MTRILKKLCRDTFNQGRSSSLIKRLAKKQGSISRLKQSRRDWWRWRQSWRSRGGLNWLVGLRMRGRRWRQLITRRCLNSTSIGMQSSSSTNQKLKRLKARLYRSINDRALNSKKLLSSQSQQEREKPVKSLTSEKWRNS